MGSVLDQITENGAYVDMGSDSEKGEIQELLINKLIVCVSDIPHHPHTLNPSYTYVANDENGRQKALSRPLFTFCIS